MARYIVIRIPILDTAPEPGETARLAITAIICEGARRIFDKLSTAAGLLDVNAVTASFEPSVAECQDVARLWEKQANDALALAKEALANAQQWERRYREASETAREAIDLARRAP